MNAEFVSQLLRPQRLVLNREPLPIGIPFVIARNIDHRTPAGPFGKPANPSAQWIVDIAGGDEHIEVRLRIGLIQARILARLMSSFRLHQSKVVDRRSLCLAQEHLRSLVALFAAKPAEINRQASAFK